jgi:acyl-coenzyme A synthetase/AMP-(fatty) acid ligase
LLRLLQDEVRSFVRASLGSLKTPKEIRIMDALPKSGPGKVLKRELRAMKGEGELTAANDALRAYDALR